MYLHTVIFVFNEPATSEIYTLSLHDALPIYNPDDEELTLRAFEESGVSNEIVVARDGAEALDFILGTGVYTDRKSTRLNSSHLGISYAVFCLKKKKKVNTHKIYTRTHSTT